MKIKHLKDKPLLVEPAGRRLGWARVTAEDVEAMEHAYFIADGKPEGFNYAEMAYLMRGLGLNRPKDPFGRKGEAYRDEEMRNECGGHWARKEWTDYALMLVHMQGIGVPYQMHPDDGEQLIGELQKRRGRGDAMGLARMHYLLKELGMPQTLTEGDERTIRKMMAHRQKEGNGWIIGKMHYHMQELGLPEPVTPQDIKAMEERLESARKKKDGRGIATLLYLMKKIHITQDTQEPPVPPLKEYVK